MFLNAVRQDRTIPANPSSTLTNFIHIVRLKRIQSEIQHSIYRVDQAPTLSHNLIGKFLDRLAHWQQHLPLKADSVPDKDDSAHGIGLIPYANDLYVSLLLNTLYIYICIY